MLHPPSGTYVFVFMLHIEVTCTQALDTRSQETLCIAYWGDLSPRHTKPRNFTHRLLGGPVASLMGGILALDTRNQESLCIAYWGDLSPRHTKPRNFMHGLLGGDLSPPHTKPINFKHRLLGGDISPRHTKPRNFIHRLLGGILALESRWMVTIFSWLPL